MSTTTAFGTGRVLLSLVIEVDDPMQTVMV